MSPAQMFPNITGQQYILQIQNIFVETVFCSFLRQQEFWKIYSMYIILKKEAAVYKIQWDSCQKPNSLTKSPIEVHFSRSNIFLLYFCGEKFLVEVLLTHAEEKWLCRILSFYEKRKTKQHKQNFFKKMETYGFCKLQTKKCEEISTTRLRYVNYLHSFSIYPHESKNKTEK